LIHFYKSFSEIKMGAREAAEKFSILTPLLDPSFGIPFDVSFQILGYDDGEYHDQETCLGVIKAHKMVLGLASPVFKSEFFGLAKEKSDTIPVKETTLKSFQRLIDFIYGKKIDWKDISVFEIFDIVNLAEKYQIPELSEEITFQLKEYPLTMENVLDIAETAAQFNQFETIVSKLLETCAIFLKSELNTEKSQLQFALKQSGTGMEKIVLHLLSMVGPECSNCRKLECMNGQLITTCDLIAEGMKITVSTTNVTHSWYGKSVTVVKVIPPSGVTLLSPLQKTSTHSLMSGAAAYFKFKCD